MHNDRPRIIEQLEPGVRRVLAPNPSPMTYWGTNTYIIGEGQVGIIDPGPGDPRHLEAIVNALEPGETVSHIFVTHSHVDHSTLAPELSRATGAPVLAYGDSRAGQSDAMRRLAAGGLAGGGEGVDHGFAPHERLADEQIVTGQGWQIRALHSPGHMGNHLCFQMDDIIFTGDHIMGWASTMVSPPDGDLSDFMASTRRLATLGARMFMPGHGAPVTAPGERAEWLIAHRKSRESEVLEALRQGPADIRRLTRAIYTDVPAGLLGAAERNVFAHLVDLTTRNRVSARPTLSFDAVFQLA